MAISNDVCVSDRAQGRLKTAIRTLALSGITALAVAGSAEARADTQRYDTIIRNGTIVDGSGLPPYAGDVAIRGGHIVAVGDVGETTAVTEIDARGFVVAPGFINIHSHAQPAAVASAVNMLTQGVTTEITNADGHGTIDITKQLADFSKNGLAENVGLFIGFNAAWRDVVGQEDRRATPAEITTMRDILDWNLAQGAWGVAAGLDYKPGYFADADEVIGILSVAGKWRTIFPNHERLRPEERYSSFKGMTETIDIAGKAGVLPVITHLKTQGAEQGNAPAVIDMMKQATARGLYTAADIYPYLAGSSGLSLMVPGWAHEGGREAMLRRFADPATRAKIITEVEEAMTLRFGGPAGVRVVRTGQTVSDAMLQMNVGAGEALIRLLEQQEQSAILSFGREDDLVAFLKYPDSAIACDCGANSGTRVHPRTWGSYPRVLGTYVRDTGALTLPDAIRKMTALPATIIGMTDRGYLAPGMRADVVVFDPAQIRDHATYDDPTLPSDGVRDVFVNGRAALRDGRPTGAQGGQAILRSAHMPSRRMTSAEESRSISGKAVVAGGDVQYAVSFAITQKGGARFSDGRLTLRVRQSGEVWTAERFGTIQTARDWASVTTILRGPAGTVQPATLTIEKGANPQIVIQLGDQGPALNGSGRAQIRQTGR